MDLHKELLYSKEHLWIKQENGQATIGITEFLVSELGDIVFVELPQEGEQIEVDESFGSVESVKTVSELYAPLSGKVIRINTDLEEKPNLINESPYDKAWLIVIEIENEKELQQLLTVNEYKKMIEI